MEGWKGGSTAQRANWGLPSGKDGSPEWTRSGRGLQGRADTMGLQPAQSSIEREGGVERAHAVPPSREPRRPFGWRAGPQPRVWTQASTLRVLLGIPSEALASNPVCVTRTLRCRVFFFS